MSLSLEKGQKVDLTKDKPNLEVITLGLGWDTQKYDGGKPFDLDACVTLLDEHGKAVGGKVVYFNNLTATGIKHSGDNLDGEGEGDDEAVVINLKEIPENIKRLGCNVVIYEAGKREQNFGQVSNAFVRVVDSSNNEELMRFDLGEDASTCTRMHLADLYLHNGEWKFQAIGGGNEGGFEELFSEIGAN